MCLNPRKEISWFESLSRDQILSYYHERIRNAAFKLAITGDFDATTVIAALKEGMEGWEKGTAYEPLPVIEPSAPAQVRMHMEGKMNTDVRLGHLIPIYRNDPRFYALMTGVHILGGNFFLAPDANRQR